MEEARKIPIREVLSNTAAMIENVRIPAGLIDEMGGPLSAAIHNLRECIAAIDAAGAPKEADDGGEDHAE